MKIKIRAKNFELTPAIDEYVTKRVQSLEKFLNPKDEVLCEVEIGRTSMHHKSGEIFRAEINIIQPGIKQVYAFAEESDLYAAIDIVRDEVERTIVSRKNKYKTLFRKGATQVKEILKRMDIRRFRRGK